MTYCLIYYQIFLERKSGMNDRQLMIKLNFVSSSHQDKATFLFLFLSQYVSVCNYVYTKYSFNPQIADTNQGGSIFFLTKLIKLNSDHVDVMC